MEVVQWSGPAVVAPGTVGSTEILGSSIFGLYLMFLGVREWRAFHPGPRRRFEVPWLLVQLVANASLRVGLGLGLKFRRIRQRHLFAWMAGVSAATAAFAIASVMVEREAARPRPRVRPWPSIALVTGGAISTAVWATRPPFGEMGGTPAWMATAVGAAVVLLAGRYFLGLVRSARAFRSTARTGLAVGAFAVALVVSADAGVVAGDRTLVFLGDLVTDWGALLIDGFPVVRAFAPLAIAFALLIGAFWPTERALERASNRGPSERTAARAGITPGRSPG